ncbi:unnamed protein product [Amoebophrya sp. A25]|nr:unnamed protein product [Amoebophrya sp. A25]|eukprot:GSA25T00009557001.1
MSDAPVAVDLHGFQCPPPGTVETPDEEGELHGPPPGTAETPDEDAGDQKEQTPAQEGEQTTSPARAASNVKTTGAGSTSKDGSKEQHHVQEGGQTIASVKRTGSTSKDGSSKEVASSGGGQDALALLRQLGGDDVLEQNSGPLAGTAANVSAGSRASSAAQTMSDMSPTKIDIEIQTALGLSSAGASSTLSQLNEHQLSAASPFPGQIPDEESNIPALPPASSYPKHQRSLAPSTRTGNSEDMDALDQPVVVESSSASSITWCNSNGDAVLRSSLNARSSSSRRHRSQRLLNTDNMQEVLKAPRRMTHRSNMRHLTRVAAGHAGDVVKEVFGEKTSGFILKKKDPIEAANYEKLFSDSADPLQNWTPLYGGQTKDPEGNEYLRLENLTSQDYEAAYVLDCKIGVRTFLESEARNEKLREDLFMKAEALAPWLLTDEEIERGTITKFRWMTIHDSQTTTIKEGWRIDGCAGSGTSITKSELQRNKTREDAIKFLSTVYMDLVAPSTGNDATTPEQGGTKGQLSSSSDGQQLHQASSAASQQDPPTTTTLLESEGRPPNMRVLSSPSSPSASDADPSSKGSPHSMGVRNDDQHRRTGHIFNGNGSTEGDWDKKKIKEEDETEDRSGVPSGGEATGAPTGQGTEAELGEPAQDITNTNEKKDKEKVPKENPNSKVVENVSVRGLPADGTRHDLSVPEGHGASTSVGVGGSSLMKDVVYAVRTSIASRLLQRKRVGSETDQKNDDGAHGRDIFAGGNANIVPGMPSNASAPAGPCLKNMRSSKPRIFSITFLRSSSN